MSTAILKEERVSIRTQPEVKERITQAAMLLGKTVSEFVLSYADEAAKLIIMKNNMIILNNEERDRFLALLDNPPSANAALKAAMLKQGEHIREFGF